MLEERVESNAIVWPDARPASVPALSDAVADATLVAIASAALPHSVAVYLGVPAAWIVLYAASALLHPRRQFWHDAACGTAIVVAPPIVRA